MGVRCVQIAHTGMRKRGGAHTPTPGRIGGVTPRVTGTPAASHEESMSVGALLGVCFWEKFLFSLIVIVVSW